MKVISVFQISFVLLIVLDVACDYIFGFGGLGLEATLILSLGITYCTNEDNKKINK